MYSFRKIAGSIVLALLLGVILLAFVLGDVAGVGSALRVASSDPVISRIGGWHLGPFTVGGTTIKGRELQSQFERELDQLNSRSSVRLTREQAIALGLSSRALRTLEQRILLDHAIADLGIVISDAQLQQVIAQTPAFQGIDGKFDPVQYRRILESVRISERQYIADLRRDTALSQILGITGGVSMPKVIRDALYRYRREQRIAEIVEVEAAKMADVPAPTAEQIKAYYDANMKRFDLPERRTLTYAALTPEDVAGEVQVGEDQLRSIYNDRKGEFDRPEKRDIDQFLVNDEAQAKKIVELVASGKTFEDAGKEAAGKDIIKLGSVVRRDLPEDLAKPAFDLKAPGLTQPVKTGLGWLVARVNKIEPGEAATFESVKARLEQEYRAQLAPDILAKRIGELEKALARSDDLDAAAQQLNITLRKAEDVDADGRGPDGKPLIEGPWAPDLLTAAFRLKQGEVSGVGETKAGHLYVARADKVTPSRTPTLDEAKDRVIAAWTAAERTKLALTRAKEIADRVNAVAELAQQARTVRSEVKTSKPVTRVDSDPATGLQGPLVAKLFELAPGKAAALPRNDGAVVLRLREIVAADPETSPTDADKLGKELDSAAANDLATQFVASLERRYGVQRDAGAFASLFRLEQ
ncbi:MAG: peptidyl-prolyl cis-trans isomerase [Alphaproteobacteria bacterium]|nr:peptidyl-prolyl cis-trans isomerase [Alphaproteobacteria bacterium]